LRAVCVCVCVCVLMCERERERERNLGGGGTRWGTARDVVLVQCLRGVRFYPPSFPLRACALNSPGAGAAALGRLFERARVRGEPAAEGIVDLAVEVRRSSGQ